MADVSVEDAITDLRTQLQKAAAAGANESLRFIPKSVEVELLIKLSTAAEVKAGAKLWSIFDFSASGKIADETTHKVKLTLEPVGKDGKPALINSKLLEK
jgi:hypothetical protein